MLAATVETSLPKIFAGQYRCEAIDCQSDCWNDPHSLPSGRYRKEAVMQGELTTTRHATPRQPACAPKPIGSTVSGAPALDESTKSFIRRALAAGLVEVDDLKKVVVSLMADTADFDPTRLADGLVGAEVLTRWQANKLLAGKSKGFYLGSYRLLRPLGKGGMGVVYLGEHHVMKRLMALKILPPEASKDARRIARFKEEARACAQLDHPNIVRAYDFAEAGEKLYIVMEYVDGIDLQRIVQRDGVMKLSDAIDVLIQAAEGLAHAHQRGIIHRDIKPSNLLLRTDGVLKVSDLGLARIGWSIDEESEQRRLMGTADFVAPEQAINSRTVDARSDIYSLSCTLFYLLTGQPPFPGDTVAQRLAKHQTSPIPDIREQRSDCPPAIAELAMRMMSKRPDDRPKSAVELLTQLQRLAGFGDDTSPPRRRKVKPVGDTSLDDSLYQATIDDTSLSADGEVEIISDAAEVEEFDFASLPVVVPSQVSAPVKSLAGPASKSVKAGKSSNRFQSTAASGRSNARNQSDPASNQQLLLGVGLTVAILALLAVVGLGVLSFLKRGTVPPNRKRPC